MFILNVVCIISEPPPPALPPPVKSLRPSFRPSPASFSPSPIGSNTSPRASPPLDIGSLIFSESSDLQEIKLRLKKIINIICRDVLTKYILKN
jgi:hypothetical protein